VSGAERRRRALDAAAPPERADRAVIHPPVIRGGAGIRSVSLVVGLFLFALGIVLQLQSDLGLSPWDVLSQGISDQTSLSFGTANIVIAIVVLAVAWALGAQIGVGTVANAILIGLFIDGLTRLEPIESLAGQGIGAQIAMLAGGIVLVSLGSGFYIGAAMGAGPRDSLMIVGARRTGVRIGIVRAAIEISVGVVGFALGGTVGIGTIAFAFGIGPAVEVVFRLLVRLGVAEPSALQREYDRRR
jgi:uncharacterized membrane protein YczE